MAKQPKRRPRAMSEDPDGDVLFNGVIFADLAIGLFWGMVSWMSIAAWNLDSGTKWQPVAWQAFWLVGLVATMASDVFFRIIAERDQPLPYRLFNSQRGGVLLTMPLWLVTIAVLGVVLAFSAGDEAPDTRVRVEKQTPAEPTVKPADR